ncbi:MAG: glycine/sarcosine/betaine reductase selenoprotein B family protein [Chloroflexi bacterium]|nr:glycine/sarcosine/betaine reductase selenoprotein B family protein [Chloroflexota bacterium]
MARLSDFAPDYAVHLRELPLPSFGTTPWTPAPALTRARVAVISTAGLHRRGDPEFAGGLGDYRILPSDIADADILMSHVSVNFDRSGFFNDVNVVFPLERLHELAAAGEIGSVARWHYSFMGATPPERLEEAAIEVARLLREDGVDAAVLVPV